MLIINKIDRHYCITSFNTVTTDSFNPQIKLFLAYMYGFHTKSIVKLVINHDSTHPMILKELSCNFTWGFNTFINKLLLMVQ